jgi:hypothetical protein
MARTTLIFGYVLVFAGLISSSAFTEVTIPPVKACQLLAHLPGMQTGPYSDRDFLGWACLTPYYVLY